MDKKNAEAQLLQELMELEGLECPMILIIEDNDGGPISNCPRGHERCLCKERGEVIYVAAPS